MTFPFTFTNMGATGYLGPTAITYGYATPGYGTPYALTLNSGIQYWTVPTTGYYRLIAAGGAAYPSNTNSSIGGQGVIVSNVVALTKGQLVLILVGQLGNYNGNGTGGGGGTFIATTASTLYNAVPLLVAGGAGGAYSTGGNTSGNNGQLTTYGSGGAGGGTGGINGNGGMSYYLTQYRIDDPGAGFYTNSGGGVTTNIWSTTPNPGGIAFINGGQNTTNNVANTTFGGGGAPGGGGGGGYSGGGGTNAGGSGACGGGGSFDINNVTGANAATLYTGVSGFSTGYNNGQGFAIVNYLGPLTPAPPVSLTVANNYVTQSLIAYYDISNTSSYSGSGTALNDLSGNGYTLTLSSAPTFKSVPANLALGSTISATSSAFTANLTANGFTIELLFAPTNISTSYTPFRYGTAFNSSCYMIQGGTYVSPANNIKIYSDSGPNSILDDVGILAGGVYTHYTITVAPTLSGSYYNVQFYNNGALVTTTSRGFTTQLSNASRTLVIGDTGGGGLGGNFALLRFYSTVLSSAQVYQNYLAAKNNNNNAYGI
jgi:tripartite motif-containing protein 56